MSLQRVKDKAGAAGRPVAAAQVKLVDDYDRDVPVGTPGEIVVRGPLVFQGYFAQPDVTAHTFRNGWHHTGDVGRFDEEGYLYYVRRKPHTPSKHARNVDDARRLWEDSEALVEKAGA